MDAKIVIGLASAIPSPGARAGIRQYDSSNAYVLAPGHGPLSRG
jgi:hypothetical protein